MKVVIEGELTDLNKFINAQRANRFGGAKVKKDNTQKCARAFAPIKAKKLKLPITLHITWYCKDKRKDPDNIAFGQKFILDGMQECGLLENDGFNQVKALHHNFEIDKEHPRIEVEIEEETE